MNDTGITRGVPTAGSASTRPSRLVRGRALALVLAAPAVMVAAAVAAAGALTPDPQAVRDLQQAVGLEFAHAGCVTAGDATNGIRARLDALGYSDWVIVSAAGVQPGNCVAAGFASSERRVILIPAVRPEVGKAIDGAARELMSRCLGKQQATELLASVLTPLGVTEWSLRTDGPLAHPIGQGEAVANHISAGCFVYSGSGYSADGQPVFYLNGPGA